MTILSIALQEVIPGLSPLETLEAAAIAALFAALMAMAKGRIDRSEHQVDDLVPTLKTTSEASRDLSTGVREYKDILTGIVTKLGSLVEIMSANGNDIRQLRAELDSLRRDLEGPSDERPAPRRRS